MTPYKLSDQKFEVAESYDELTIEQFILLAN